MAVFISYSHSNAKFVDRLALELVKARAHVWLDRWELSVGDSLTQRIQSALQDAGALLVVLSPASVASEWCKRELTAGLVRELEERRVVVLPLLLEDCDIPLFLRDKLYADFRQDFKSGFEAVIKAISKVANDARSRIEDPKWHTDWAMDWGIDSVGLRVTLTFVEQAIDRPYTVQTVVTAFGNVPATERYVAYSREKLGWVYSHVVAEALAHAIAQEDLRMILGNNNPHVHSFGMSDDASDIEYRVRIEYRLLGEDTGADVLVDVANLLREARAHMAKSSRQPTPEELTRIASLVSKLDE